MIWFAFGSFALVLLALSVITAIFMWNWLHDRDWDYMWPAFTFVILVVPFAISLIWLVSHCREPLLPPPANAELAQPR